MNWFSIASIIVPIVISIIILFVRMEINIAIQKVEATHIAENLKAHICSTNETLKIIGEKLDSIIQYNLNLKTKQNESN